MGRCGALMWKVKRVQTQDRIVLSLSGRLQGEQLNELQEVLASEPPIRNWCSI